MMTVYLHDIPLEKAKAQLLTALKEAGLDQILGSETIPLDENASGRVLAEPIWARISAPHYHASAMDGFALRAETTSGATPSDPISLVCTSDIGESQAVYLDTGDPLPAWADAVVPIENVEPLDETNHPSANPRKPALIRIRAAVIPWQHIRPMGEDMVATQLVIPAGQVLRPVDLGAIAGCGHSQVQVARKPRVAILPTGTELAPIGQPVGSGQIIEYNSLVLAAQVNQWGGEAMRFSITPDVHEAIRSRVQEAAASSDLILLNAGSSAGAEDYSAQVVQSLGTLLVHGVAVRPGHPVILGMVDRPAIEGGSKTGRVPIIGVPGYPVSAALTAEIFVEPLLALWLGRQTLEPVEISATLTRKVTSPAGDDDYMRMAVGKVGEKMLAAPLSRGAGVITSLVRADGITILPRGMQGLPAGAEVKVRLYRSPAELMHTIFAIGSHDMTLDVIAQHLAQRGRRLASSNVGSQGGLVALSRGEAHIAGSHLLDPELGEYNLSYIRKYLKGTPVKVVDLVGRQQGLILQPGNPLQIYRLEDLARPGVTFVNRQRGAGTRVLLDYHLGLLGIDPQAISGYQQEEYTHLAVAAAVSSGRAACGLGIAAAAKALELDFIPLFQEKYQLVVPQETYDSELLIPLWDVLRDEDFRKTIAKLPGYDISNMGVLAAEVA